ncbi:hypothetical protein TraAM80_07563 [Trypanosoma rangeli]|uniref:Uncharacterized protein n=1 Tax=Trypanosoma rangeli TaxID=5698 RepID=A0A422N4R9_TRYRA|nr:uncharacterized protein TraAM80_07563 [Trypanosoma rangeli]RNF00483.1 hypothetical protein TraAM80_07563 [Trypanosoma rangeli]|eukprot:RNF00483.1 hypothetical protein TraAM80_07563 [Trypanosoma rangeli]
MAGLQKRAWLTLMALHTAGCKTGVKTKPRSSSESGVACHAHLSAVEATSIVMRPHDIGTTFMSKTLFQIPATEEGTTVRHQCQPDPVLFTFPMDGRHLFMAYGSERCQRDGGSRVYVVRLCLDGPPTFLVSYLPIAIISGCVQNYSVHPSPWSGQAAPVSVAGETGAETGGCVQLPEEVARETVRRGAQPMQMVSSCPDQVYPFLVADAAMHAIWAVEVDTATLAVRLVTPYQYWKRNGGGDDVAPADNVNPLQEEPQQRGSVFASKPKALLGGVEGFVDGPFHLARFASPAALCWRLDGEAHAADAAREAGQPHIQRGTSHSDVLFVSDRGNHAVRQVNFQSKMVRTILGIDGVPGYRDGDCRVSRLQEAASLVWCTSGLLFLDKPNGAIRLITRLKEKKQMTDAKNEEEVGSHQHIAQPDISAAASVKPATHVTCRVWTVAGGLYVNMGLYVDAKEPHRASLGTPSTLALAPDGEGVLFADSQYGALRLVSLRGVETFFGFHNLSNSFCVPAGLMACTHVLLCRLTTLNGVSRDAFLVSSGVQGTVSLLVPYNQMEAAEEGARVDIKSTTITSLVTEDCVVVAAGVLRKHTCIDGKSCTHAMGAAEAVSCRRKQARGDDYGLHLRDNLREVASPSLTEHAGVPSRVHFLQMSSSDGPLVAATRRLFEVYAYYASKTIAPSTMTDVCHLQAVQRRGRLSVSYSLSLMRFWRFLTHTEYFGGGTLKTTSLAASSACMAPAAVSLSGNENIAAGVMCWKDWRCVAELFHMLSVRQHGYSVLSVVNFSQFCRIILAFHCWMRWQRRRETRKTEEGREKEEGVHRGVDRLMRVSIDELSETEVVEVYEDTVRQVKSVNIHLQLAVDEPHNNAEAGGRGGGGEFLAADDVLRVLVRNEKPLRQLFDAYSQRLVPPQSSASTAAKSEEARNLRWLRAMLLSADTGGHAGADAVYGVPYGMFHKLFHALDVFPSLLSEALLRRAYVDALLTPLFQTLRRAVFTVDEHEKGEQQQQFMPFALAISQDVEKRHAGGGTGLAFIPFVEAFTRVALTAFSLCIEHDRRMYPTAAAKVEALMRWVNRSVEQFHQRERGDAATHCIAARRECAAGRRALLFASFLFFDVPARAGGRHSGLGDMRTGGMCSP